MTERRAIDDRTDDELAREARAGSRPSFEELARRYKRRLFGYLRPRLGSDEDTEDLVQETFLKLYRNIAQLRSRVPVLDLALYVGQQVGHRRLSKRCYDEVRRTLAHPLAKLVLLGLLWSFMHHLCAGIRYLFLDLDKGVDLPTARMTSVIVAAAGVGLTALFAGLLLW